MSIDKMADYLGDKLMQEHGVFLTPETLRDLVTGMDFGGGHVPDATEMVQGDVVSMGDLADENGALYELSFLLKFSSVEDFLAAMQAGQCRFTVFGGEV